MIFKTKSGSTYEVVDGRIRQLYNGSGNQHRIKGEWRQATKVIVALGKPAIIYWGSGTDERSPAMSEEMAAINQRFTETSKVTEILP